jgi:phycobilisome rod-core linker protein
MTLPLLNYPLSSQNQRVNGFEVSGDEQPRIYDLENLPKGIEIDELIWACYRQLFNEQQIINYHRQMPLESQLRSYQITVKDFIRGLALSDSFRRLNYDTNNNYRFVEMCIQRLLGRQIYNHRETLAWSIILATKGLKGFIDAFLDSDEYLDNFGELKVPYQRRRILHQRDQGDLPFARMGRYDSYYLSQLPKVKYWRSFNNGVIDRSTSAYRKVLFLVPTASVALLVVTLICVITS